MNREFYIDTPLGRLKVWAKHEIDSPKDFPGVYIDLMTLAGPEILACVEYDSCHKHLQTCVYRPCEDSPTHVFVQELPKQYYPMEEQINNCHKFLGIEAKDANEMTEDELFAAECKMREHFRWVGSPEYIQEIPQHIETGAYIL